mmetsp:Transcript_61301/g.150850  ORF Transcript_61301/g.150850 Transcript_61301/m.150850 type:complete len:90 (+) Transcript_61301:1440-1709(+)
MNIVCHLSSFKNDTEHRAPTLYEGSPLSIASTMSSERVELHEHKIKLAHQSIHLVLDDPDPVVHSREVSFELSHLLSTRLLLLIHLQLP